MDPLADIEALVELGGRGPGTDAERRAASHLERRLTDLGRDAQIEPIEVHPAQELTRASGARLASR